MFYQSVRHSALNGRRGRVVYRSITRAMIILLPSSLLLVTSLPEAYTLSSIRQSTREASSVQTDNDVIEPGRPINRQLAGGQQHSYQINLAADQFLKTVIDNDGVDVAVQVFGPNGKLILEFDSERSLSGHEPVSLVAEATGTYRLIIRPEQNWAPAGNYEIRIDELRSATETDRALQDAHRLNEAARRLRDAGKYAEALPLFERVIETRNRISGPLDRDLASALHDLAVFYYYKGDYPKIEPLSSRALAIQEKTLGPEHTDVAASLNLLANISFNKGDYASAEPLSIRALAIKEKAIGPEHLAALVDEQNQYLIERYTISYLTSGRDLMRLQDSSPSQNAPLVVADPLFGPATSDSERAAQRSGISPAIHRTGQPGQMGQPGQLEQPVFLPLPGTKAEALAIKAVIPEAAVFLQQEATEAVLKRARAPRILHIATHGFFFNDQPAQPAETNDISDDNFTLGSDLRLSRRAAHIEEPLLRSGLALSGANRNMKGNDDGMLTALEVAGLDLLGTRLVVLSACDTGVGDIKNGEGVQGLRRALVLAGSESQVMSLWPVTDEGAKELMIDYYRALQRGEGRSEGLRQVQLRMLRSKQRRHPFYWAAFIQSGEWANLDGRR